MPFQRTSIGPIAVVTVLACTGAEFAVAQNPAPCRILGREGPQPHGGYETNLWPDGVVPYEFDANVTQLNQNYTLFAMNAWQAVADVYFRERVETDANWVHIQSSTGNNSYVGMQSGSQIINIVSWSYMYIIAHELGHALGLEHEHERPDRDQYISINSANIQAGYEFAFNISGIAFGLYDFDSVMHYDGCSFSTCCSAGGTCSCNGSCQTITVLPPYQAQQTSIGQRTHLSVGDANMMRWLYPGCGWMNDYLSDQVKVISADPGAGESFGWSVAVSDNTIVVGAYLDNSAGSAGPGAAYVYVQVDGNWIQQVKLVASDAAAGDNFGYAVAISGDTVVIGSRGDDRSNLTDTGSAYVYMRANGVWVQSAKLIAADAASNDMFGTSVALFGDTAVVGSPSDDHAGGTDAGSVYVFVRGSNGIWTQQANLVASDAASSTGFGNSVALSGGTVLIGASGDDHVSGSNAGSAYVFVRNGNIWGQEAKLIASDAASSDFFGRSVAISGDTAVTGSWGNDDAGSNSGSAYVFVRNAGTWSEQQKLAASDAAANDDFGYSVAVAGDKVVVGADNDSQGALSGAGSAYYFGRDGGVWSQRVKLTAFDIGSGDRFGAAVALSGDIAVVGAYFDSHSGFTAAGSAYVQKLRPVCKGDVDGNGQIQFADIETFVQVVLTGQGTTNQVRAADMDCNGVPNGVDIHLFVESYVAGGDCP